MFVFMIITSTFLIQGTLSNNDSCEDCLIEGGSCFGPHPEDCTKYVQCQWKGDNVREIIRSCPFGQFWDADQLSCRSSSLVRCETDPCKQIKPSLTYKMTGHGCRAFWRCVDGFSVADCCPRGSAYVTGRDCLKEQLCNQTCPAEDKKSL